MKKIILSVIVSLFLLLDISSTGRVKYSFRHLTVNDGLSSSRISTICRDNRGYVWFGTNFGLNRYDGYRIKSYIAGEDDGINLNSNVINSVYEDSKGRLLVLSTGGLSLYNYDTDTFSIIVNKRNVTTIFEDTNGDILLGTIEGRIIRLNRDLTIISELELESRMIIDIQKFDSENYIVSYRFNGIHLYNMKTNTSESFVKDYSFKRKNITDIVKSNNNEYFVSSIVDGVVKIKDRRVVDRFSLNNGKLNSNNVHKMLKVNENYWFINDGGGINVLNYSTNEIYNIEANIFDNFSLHDNFLLTAFKDKKDNVWIGTVKDGVYHTNLNNWYEYYTSANWKLSKSFSNTIWSLLNEDEVVWLGSDKGRLIEFNTKDKSFKTHDLRHKHRLNNIMAIDRFDDELFIGTFSTGLYLYNPKTRTTKSFDQISDPNIWLVHKEKSGSLLVSGNQLYRLHKRNNGTYKVDTILPMTPLTTALLEDKRTLYLGKYENIVRYNIDESRVEDTLALKRNYIIYGIYKIGENLWIGTEKGLIEYSLKNNTETLHKVGIEANSNIISAIIKENNRFLWLATDKGIYRYNVITKKASLYNDPHQIFNAQHGRNTMSVGANGEIYIGSSSGFLIIDPNKIPDETAKIPVTITDYTIFNKPVKSKGNWLGYQVLPNGDSKIEIEPYQSVFGFNFSSLRYKYPKSIKYAYKLEGVDKNWIITTERRVEYKDIDPGKYVFKVKASHSNEWGNDYRGVEITIKPFWWKTWYFNLFIFLIITAVLYALWHQQLLRRNLKNERILNDKKEELNNQKLQFFTNISHELRTPLTLIKGPLNKLLKQDELKGNPELDLMKRNSERLMYLVNQIMDFRKVEASKMELKVSNSDIVDFCRVIAEQFEISFKNKGVDFVFISLLDIGNVWFDKDKIYKILTNLLSNALKHTSEGDDVSVIMKFDKKKQNIIIEVKDSGRGISKKDLPHIFERFYKADNFAGTGIGLSLSKSLANIHKGDIKIESKENVGTTMFVTIPSYDIYKKSEKTTDERDVENFPVVIASEHKLTEINKNRNTVLLVDDSPDILDYLVSGLKGHYNCIVARDGEEALEKAIKEIPDVVICDVMMPKMDGLEFTQELKCNLDTSHIPVFLLTACVGTESQITGLKSGADDYIEKPFEIDTLILKLNNLLVSRKQLKKRFTSDMGVSVEDIAYSTADEKFITKLSQLINDNMSNPTLSVDFIVDNIGMSRSAVYRNVKKLTGLSTNEFIATIRLKQSMEILQTTNKPIGEVAVMVGYSDPKYFSRCFKKHFGELPSKFKS